VIPKEFETKYAFVTFFSRAKDYGRFSKRTLVLINLQPNKGPQVIDRKTTDLRKILYTLTF
jgi:hypothetical protein